MRFDESYSTSLWHIPGSASRAPARPVLRTHMGPPCMSIELMTLVWKIQMRPYEKLILLALADYAYPNGDHVFPSVQSMANKTTCSARKIQMTMREFETQGFLELVVEASRRSPRQYRLNVPALHELAARGARRAPPNATSRGVRHDVLGGTLRHPEVHATTSGGAGRAPNPSITAKEPSEDPSLHPPPPAAGDGATFEVFWQLYPNKRSREAAARAWKKLAPSAALAETVLAALADQMVSDEWRREGGRFIPFPAKWLNGKRWEDQLAANETVPDRHVNDAWASKTEAREVKL